MSDEVNDYLGAAGKSNADGSGGPGEVLTAVAMVGAEVGELRAHLADVLNDMTGLRADVTGLGEAVTGLSKLSLEVGQLAAMVDQLLNGDEQNKIPKPVDLANIKPADRTKVLTELLTWVRSVLFDGWPWTQERLRACWPQHPDLINDLLLLKTCYAAAYKATDRRSHHAVEYRHLLDYVMDVADQRTRQCPAEDQHEVPLPPRNDQQAMAAASRDMMLAEVWRLTEQANQARNAGAHDLASQAEDRAAQLFEKYQITPPEYQAYEQRVQDTRVAVRARETQRRSADKD
jgi:hypothetical protein